MVYERLLRLVKTLFFLYYMRDDADEIGREKWGSGGMGNGGAGEGKRRET